MRQVSPSYSVNIGILYVSIVLVIIFGVYLSNVLGSSPSVGISQSPYSSSSSCSSSFNYGSSNPISVLVASSNSTGTICVEYGNSLNNSVSFPAYPTVYEYNRSGVYGVCGYCVFNVVSSIRGVASPSNVTFVASANPDSEAENVTYSIIVPSDVKSGVYGIFLPQFCSLFPLVVVPNSSSTLQLNRSEFSSWYPHEGSCPDQFLSALVVGVSGFQIALL